MYTCSYIEFMTISTSLVNVTVMDLWKNKKIDDDDYIMCKNGEI